MPKTFEAGPGIIGIDTMMAGYENVTSAFLLEALEPTLIETGPASSAKAVTEALWGLGLAPEALAHVVVTHIHLDHSGGAGVLASAFPQATIWAHERGAPHLADPERLLRSAARLYGGRLVELFGETMPVPSGRLRSIEEGDTIDMGNRHLNVMYTPGHASHHVSLQDSDTRAVFVGDAVGVHLPSVSQVRPATPPPEFDIELAIDSIRRIETQARGSIMFSHFGPTTAVADICDRAVEAIRRWGEVVRVALGSTDDDDEVAKILERETAPDLAGVSEEDRARFDILGSYAVTARGLARYWRGRLDPPPPNQSS